MSSAALQTCVVQSLTTSSGHSGACRTRSASLSSSHCRTVGAGPGATARTRASSTATLRRAKALLNSTGLASSSFTGSWIELFPRVKVVTRTANIKAASLWRGGNSAAVLALFMIANIRGWSSLTPHEKKPYQAYIRAARGV